MPFKNIIVITNSQDAYSRTWTDLYRKDEEHDYLDWYNDPDRVSEYQALGLPDPSAFPSVVCTETKEIIRQPETMNAAMAQFTPTTTDGKWERIRQNRDALLATCDWTQLADAPLTDDEKAIWKTYRQALRDLPQTYSDPSDVVFPTVPL